MKRLLIVDLVCPKPYVCQSLETETLGGTEATVIRLLRSLSQFYQITVLQRGRTDKIEENGVWFQGEPDGKVPYHIDLVVTLRDSITHKRYKIKYPEAKHILWLHDLVTSQLFEHMTPNSQVVCVSEFHKAQFRDFLLEDSITSHITQVSSHTIYNPIEPGLPGPGPYDKYKLVYFSSPHKGLEETLNAFKVLHAYDSKFQLYVANPGYMASRGGLPDGVHDLGVLKHRDVIEHVRGALCVFYLNRVFPETMGLVFAEANAVGTPVLTHPIGAAREILDHPYELIDTTDTVAVVDRIVAWSQGARPIVRARPEFSIGEVTKQWKNLLK